MALLHCNDHFSLVDYVRHEQKCFFLLLLLRRGVENRISRGMIWSLEILLASISLSHVCKW